MFQAAIPLATSTICDADHLPRGGCRCQDPPVLPVLRSDVAMRILCRHWPPALSATGLSIQINTDHDHEKVISDRESRHETPHDDRPFDQLVHQIVYVRQRTSPMGPAEYPILPRRLRSAIAILGDLQIMAEYITPPAITPPATAPATNTFLSAQNTFLRVNSHEISNCVTP
jgi:hypothetical protein